MFMEKSVDRETRDFMNVESFSQLPFIRPAAIKEKAADIKLFGIEFGSGDTVNPSVVTNEEAESSETATNAFDAHTKVDENCTENSESNRRFECHYCCRNFPTSQALGGHQNAHKRERQHAKRAHLQSATVHNRFSESHVYGLMNYRLSSVSTPSIAYPIWNSSSSGSIANGHGTIYGSHGGLYSSRQPINGSPLGMWRIPAVQSNPTFSHDRSLHPLPLFATEDLNSKASQVVGSAGNSQSRYSTNYDSKPRVEDPVSLDLHL